MIRTNDTEGDSHLLHSSTWDRSVFYSVAKSSAQRAAARTQSSVWGAARLIGIANWQLDSWPCFGAELIIERRRRFAESRRGLKPAELFGFLHFTHEENSLLLHFTIGREGYVKVLKVERCDLSDQIHSDSRWLGGAVSGDSAMMT